MATNTGYQSTEKLNTRDEKELYSVNYEDILSGIDSAREQCVQDEKSGDDTELQLELEISDSLKDIISSPEKNNSVLLDIEIIRPSEENTRRPSRRTTPEKSDIRNLIASLERERQLKKKLIESYEINEKPIVQSNVKRVAAASAPVRLPVNYKFRRKCGNYRETVNKIRKVKEASSLEYVEYETSREHLHPCPVDFNFARKLSKGKMESPNLENDIKDIHFAFTNEDITEQVYAALNYNRVRAKYPCQNKEPLSDGKMDHPCPCRNCAMVGVLMDSQKRPIYTPSMESPDAGRQSRSKSSQEAESCSSSRAVNRRQQTAKTDDYNGKLKALIKKLQMLESRIEQHEERTVSRECFVRIVNKIVEYIDLLDKSDRRRVSQRETTQSDQTTQADSIVPLLDIQKKSKKCLTKKVNKRTSCQLDPFPLERRVHQRDKGINTSTANFVFPKMKEATIFKNQNYFLYWGKEVIKPGLDLKYKIMDLFDEKFKNIQPIQSSGERKDPETAKGTLTERNFKRNDHYEEPLQNSFPSFVKRYLENKSKGIAYAKDDTYADNGTHQKLHRSSHISLNKLGLPRNKAPVKPPHTLKKEDLPKKAEGVVSDGVSIAYVNPNFNLWHKYSS